MPGGGGRIVFLCFQLRLLDLSENMISIDGVMYLVAMLSTAQAAPPSH